MRDDLIDSHLSFGQSAFDNLGYAAFSGGARWEPDKQ